MESALRFGARLCPHLFMHLPTALGSTLPMFADEETEALPCALNHSLLAGPWFLPQPKPLALAPLKEQGQKGTPPPPCLFPVPPTWGARASLLNPHTELLHQKEDLWTGCFGFGVFVLSLSLVRPPHPHPL